MPDKKSGPGEAELFALLLEKKLLSSAQVEVAKIDIAATGMNAIDVLLARKWISEEDIAGFAGFAGVAGSTVPTVTAAATSEQTYLDNLKKYRQLMAKIMGEAD